MRLHSIITVIVASALALGLVIVGCDDTSSKIGGPVPLVDGGNTGGNPNGDGGIGQDGGGGIQDAPPITPTSDGGF